MRLSQITDLSAADVEISGLTADSRMVKAGMLYAALPGSKADGAQFIPDAMMHGAAAVLVGKSVAVPSDVVAVAADNPRLEFAKMAARFYGRQPETVVAVTGTSGKTSTVTFTQQIWALTGVEKPASLGTLGIHAPGIEKKGSLTTPDTVSLHAELSDLAAAGVTHLAMEASSHGLDQYRLDGVKIKAAAYTNLSRDHLDYHADMDAYFAAKARLFSELLTTNGVAVLNADDARFAELQKICAARDVKILSFGQDAKDIRIIGHERRPEGQILNLDVLGNSHQIILPLVGDFQVMNALAALGLVIGSGGSADRGVAALEALTGVPGRIQSVGAGVYVDYAHKPGALGTVLKTLRPHANGRLICVFGCGGDRDTGKRPVMGKIASDNADIVIVTDDNPRSEEPAKIRAAILEGATGAKEIGDRAEAIAHAVSMMQDGDILVIAGKGHETGQIVGDRILPFDDAEQARNALQKIQKEKV